MDKILACKTYEITPGKMVKVEIRSNVSIS